VIPVIVIAEYRYGIMRLPGPMRHTYSAWLDRVLEKTLVAAVELATTEYYASLRMNLQSRGLPLSVNDLWIASVALERNLPVASRDADFDRVEGLTRITW
jgi:tRNA(fMet)-specific endonuclease VapC